VRAVTSATIARRHLRGYLEFTRNSGGFGAFELDAGGDPVMVGRPLVCRREAVTAAR
jgi:hypothetical protein